MTGPAPFAPTSRSLATESCESDPMEAANPMDTLTTGHYPNFRLRMPQWSGDRLSRVGIGGVVVRTGRVAVLPANGFEHFIA